MNPHNDAETVIRARGLSRSFGSLTAVDNMDLDVRRGEIFGFLGPNGAGKSTLIRMLVGLLSPSRGSVDVLGLAMPRRADTLRPKVGYMTQKFSLYEDLSVQENLEFAAEIFGLPRKALKPRIEEVLAEYHLQERRDQRPATLSGGWKQRLALAVATVHRPELLFLDEPTADCRDRRRRMFWEKLFDLAAGGATILVSTHYMDEAVRCHRLCLMRDGRKSALGAPFDLMDAMRGRIVEFIASPADKVLDFLVKREDVASATQMGHRIHVLLEPSAPPSSQAAPILARAVEARGFSLSLAESAEPNLEDVFVALTHGEHMPGGQV